MITKRILYIAILFVLFACQSVDQPKVPENLIERQKMINILTDIAFVKAAKSAHKKVFEKENIDPEAYILQKYDIDSLTFTENSNWYVSQLKEYDEIFRKVKDTLKYRKDLVERVKKEKDSLQKIHDSIQKLKNGKSVEETIDISSEEEEGIMEEETQNDGKKTDHKKLDKIRKE